MLEETKQEAVVVETETEEDCLTVDEVLPVPAGTLALATKEDKIRAKHVASQMYLRLDCPSVTDLSRQLGIPSEMLHSWKKQGHWDDKRMQILADHARAHDASLSYFQAEERLAVAKRHLQGAERIEEIVMEDIEAIASLDAGTKERIVAMRRLTETFGMVTNVAARASALGKAADLTDYFGNNSGKGSRINIGIEKAVVAVKM